MLQYKKYSLYPKNFDFAATPLCLSSPSQEELLCQCCPLDLVEVKKRGSLGAPEQANPHSREIEKLLGQEVEDVSPLLGDRKIQIKSLYHIEISVGF